MHAPGKYVTAQNAKEAALLLLNSVVYAQKGQSNLLIVRDLESPVESLEVALYYIKVSGRAIPVIFKGNPPGYSEKFFRGQLDWSHPEELNQLINVYEYKYKWLNAAEDIIISHICPVKKITLMQVVEQLIDIQDEHTLKEELTEQLKLLVQGSLKIVDKQDTVHILQWGLQEKYLRPENATINDFELTVSLLVSSLAGSEFYSSVQPLIFT